MLLMLRLRFPHNFLSRPFRLSDDAPFPTIPPRENVISGGRLDNERKFSPACVSFSFVSRLPSRGSRPKSYDSLPSQKSNLPSVSYFFSTCSSNDFQIVCFYITPLKGGGTRRPIFQKIILIFPFQKRTSSSRPPNLPTEISHDDELSFRRNVRFFGKPSSSSTTTTVVIIVEKTRGRDESRGSGREETIR